MPFNETYAALWYRAQSVEFGTSIQILETDRRAITNDLYRTRDEIGDPELKAIKICHPATKEPEIWLVKETVDLDA